MVHSYLNCHTFPPFLASVERFEPAMVTSFHTFHLPTMPTLSDFIHYNGPPTAKPAKKPSARRRAGEPASPTGPWTDIDEIDIPKHPGDDTSSPTTHSARNVNQR